MRRHDRDRQAIWDSLDAFLDDDSDLDERIIRAMAEADGDVHDLGSLFTEEDIAELDFPDD